jgi:Uncharacterized protein conserved in bacteria (DUF2345)
MGMASFAGRDGSFAVQGDVHQTAAHTWASVSGKTSSWYVHEGGVKAVAAHGAVSLRAHTDALQIWADKEVTVISVNDEIRISAQSKIELIAGKSAITLEGSDIEFKTESPRILRRLQSLRGWSHEEDKEVLTRGTRARSANGFRSPRRVPIAVGRWTYPDITDTRGLHFQFAF